MAVDGDIGVLETLTKQFGQDIEKLETLNRRFADLESKLDSGTLLTEQEQKRVIRAARVLTTHLRDAYALQKLLGEGRGRPEFPWEGRKKPMKRGRPVFLQISDDALAFGIDEWIKPKLKEKNRFKKKITDKEAVEFYLRDLARSRNHSYERRYSRQIRRYCNRVSNGRKLLKKLFTKNIPELS